MNRFPQASVKTTFYCTAVAVVKILAKLFKGALFENKIVCIIISLGISIAYCSHVQQLSWLLDSAGSKFIFSCIDIYNRVCIAESSYLSLGVRMNRPPFQWENPI